MMNKIMAVVLVMFLIGGITLACKTKSPVAELPQNRQQIETVTSGNPPAYDYWSDIPKWFKAELKQNPSIPQNVTEEVGNWDNISWRHYETADAYPTIRQFYRGTQTTPQVFIQGMATHGWTEVTLRDQGTTSIDVWEKGNARAMIWIEPWGIGTTVYIALSIRS